MFTQFIYKSGSNPYITTTNSRLFQMICKYYVEQFDNNSFVVTGLREWNGRKSYEGKKEVLRAFAIEWQRFFAETSYSYGELANWQNFFEELGKKYGLISEFKENAII